MALADAKRNTDGRAFWSMPDLAGESYDEVLERFHSILRPRTYLEIGVSKGSTLALAQGHAIGIDPDFDISLPPITKNKAICHLYQMTSDNFFRNYNPSSIFGQEIDLAFLDGMHLYEYLIRDFINVEKYCKNNSIVIMHDCVPIDEYLARRNPEEVSLMSKSKHSDWWAGDVWKIIAILKKYRTDLRIMILDAPPTGLVIVTNLDPSSNVLSNRYFDILAEFCDLTIEKCTHLFEGETAIGSTKSISTAETLSQFFWL
jgi:hypothetical protein